MVFSTVERRRQNNVAPKEFSEGIIVSCAGISANGRLWCHKLRKGKAGLFGSREKTIWRRRWWRRALRFINPVVGTFLWISVPITVKELAWSLFLGKCWMSTCSYKITLMKEMGHICFGWTSKQIWMDTFVAKTFFKTLTRIVISAFVTSL